MNQINTNTQRGGLLMKGNAVLPETIRRDRKRDVFTHFVLLKPPPPPTPTSGVLDIKKKTEI